MRRLRARNPVGDWAAIDASAEHGARRYDAVARRARLGSARGRRIGVRIRRLARGAPTPPLLLAICRRSCDPPSSARSARAIRSPSSPTESSTIQTRYAACRAGRASSCCRTRLRRDAALVSIDVPRAVVSGDTVEYASGDRRRNGGGARAGTLQLDARRQNHRDGAGRFDCGRSANERSISRSKLDGAAGPSILRAVVASPDDAEPRNDTLSVAIDLSRAASAVFASTSPDFDARYSLAVLRGALGIPTRGYFRVAPGEWRIEGALTPVDRGRGAAGACATRRSRSSTATRARSARRER